MNKIISAAIDAESAAWDRLVDIYPDADALVLAQDLANVPDHAKGAAAIWGAAFAFLAALESGAAR